MNQPTETNRAADRLVADARRAVHEALVYLPAPEADRVCSLLADLETAVEGRTAMRFAAPAVVSAPVPPTGQTALRDRIAEALYPTYGQEDRNRSLAIADAVLAELPAPVTRSGWDALCQESGRLRKTSADLVARAEHIEAEVRELADLRARVLDEAADAIDAETRRLKADGVLEPDKYRPCRDASTQLRRLAAEARGAQQDDGLPFVRRVLEIFSASHADAYGDLLWHVDDNGVHLSADVSDVFAWGGADCEPITPDTLPALEQDYLDLKAVDGEDFLAPLYAARQRHQRPQGAAYPSGTHKAWQEVSALYDACGPERELNLGNPKQAPAHKAAAAPQHAGGNGDDCPACQTAGLDTIGYPFECPGNSEQQEADRG